ncbi:hypothetical protein F4781DRAFT_381409 [Annulohypoxylon bovei var. microspora]|nr:hypothetical protein F4781DRAFT_381409 [Annulohypoxylon bovei var. microspora]
MGWLSFLSRKAPVKNQDNGLKAQAYDETVAANPPIRGTYPVAGNGPNILEKFQKSHPHLRDTNFNDSSAPHPALPPFLERPNTAPTRRSPEAPVRPKSHSGGSVKPLPPPPKKRHGPYKLPSKIPNERNDDIANKSIYSVPSPTFVRNRNSSILSGDSGSTRRFVDLLDAQSFIKPADFYGRVKANGAKDYGEDVADRNLRENRSSVNPTQAEELLTNTFTFSVHGDDKDVNRLPSSRKRHSMGSGLRTKSISSNFHSTLPMIVSPEIPQEDEVKSATAPVRKAPRRKSLHSYVPPSTELSVGRPRSASATKRVEGTELNYFPDSLREIARAVALGVFERDLSMDLNDLNLEVKSIRSSRNARETLARELDSDSDISYHTPNDSRQAPPTQVDQCRSAKSSSRRRSTSNVSSLTAFKQPSKNGNLQTPQSPNRRGSMVQNSLPGVEEDLHSKKNRSLSRRGYEANFDIHDSFYEFSSSHPAELLESKSAYSRPSSRDERNYRDRNRSVVSVSAKSTKHSGMGDVVPERGSSIRRWSLTSETGGSTLSSNPFRPQSGHTTNTSVDLAPRGPLPKATESHQTSFLSEGNHKVSEDQQELNTHGPLYREFDPELLAGSNRRQRSIDFVIDEDASSIDSFDNPQHSAGEFERDLLFQGYGFEGSQLPGLFDAGASKPRTTPSRRTHSFSAHRDSYHLAALDSNPGILSLGSQYSTRSLQYTSRPRSSRFQMPDFSDSDSECGGGSEPKYDSEEDLNFDIPLTRSIGSRCHSHSSRRQYETTAELLREGDSEFPDIPRIAHLRREMKAKQRASTGSLRRAKGKGKATDIGIPRIGLDDTSHYADAES